LLRGTLRSAPPRLPESHPKKRSGEWRAFRSDFGDVNELGTAMQDFPKQIEWTIAFSGKALGHVESSMPASWPSYSEVGVQLLPAHQDMPHQGRPSPEYQRWASDEPLYRPLVLVSQPHVIDPDQWKPIKLASSYPKAAVPELRKRIKEEDSNLKFSDRDVQAASACSSNEGRVVFALTAPSLRGLHWFVADTRSSVRFLGSELVYLDAGDYDVDGHSEIIFKKSGYNQDGYVLFSADFRHSAEFSWSSH
jgi:hypothetical protein